MPQIDTYTAQTKPAVPDQPLRFMQTGENPAARIQAQGEHLGDKLAEIGGRINAQAVDLEFLQNKAKREAGSAQAILDLQNDPEIINDPQQFAVRYRERMAQIDHDLELGFKHADAKAHYQFYKGVNLDEEGVKAQAIGLKMQANKNAGDFIVAKDQLSTKAASAQSDKELNDAINSFHMLVTNTVNKKGLTQEEGARELVTFRQDSALKQMKTIGLQDPERMRSMLANGSWPNDMVSSDKKQQVIEEVNTREHVANARKAEVVKQVQGVYNEDLLSRAAYGKVTDAEIQKGLDGKDPFLPHVGAWLHIQELNAKAPGINGAGRSDDAITQAVDAIRARHDINQNPDKKDAQAALGELQLILDEGGMSAKARQHLIGAATHFQSKIERYDSEDRSIEAQSRARAGELRAIDAKTKADANNQRTIEDRKVHDAHVEFDARYERAFMGRIVGKMDNIERIQKRNALESLIRNNPNLTKDEALNSILGPAGALEKKGAGADNNVDRLLRKRP